MADAIDRAQQANDFWTQRQIQDHHQRMAIQAGQPSALYCEECEEEIPEARREKVPGCQRCVECQERIDDGR